MKDITAQQLSANISQALWKMGIADRNASAEQLYRATAKVLVDLMSVGQRQTLAHNIAHKNKRVSYLSMEFLPGRSLRNALFAMGLVESMQEALADFGVTVETLTPYEPDAALGNGGLGRLAACYLDAMSTQNIWGYGYCILYEFGIFRQKLQDGWQEELPDSWLPGGDVWLEQKPEHAVEVRFGGSVKESWENGFHHVTHTGYSTVTAVPYDLYVPAYDGSTVNTLRLFQAQSPGIDMQKFHNGDYIGAFGATSVAETISKVLYPNDSHLEGKRLRLRQQYFLSAASVADIIRTHLANYQTLETLSAQNVIQINDTHPVLAIPEMLRVLLDECGYDWEDAYRIVSDTFCYTNHTVMSEALEVWEETLIAELMPRIHQIILEINRRFCDRLYRQGAKERQVAEMAILSFGKIRMANLAVCVCRSVNGVSRLHSSILTESLFANNVRFEPQKFTNVTNGIAARRWLNQANPELAALIEQYIGTEYRHDFSMLSQLRSHCDNPALQQGLLAVRHQNKIRLCGTLKQLQGVDISPDFIFDMQLKRLHEYKRQLLHALSVLADYLTLLENPDADLLPRVHLFGAKAAPGYYIAKQIIRFICKLGELCEKNDRVRHKLRVVFVENYSVSLSEELMPAADFSEQISLAGTEASGTGNMKFMLNGAITIGTLDGANVEMCEHAGRENMLIFGLTTQEVRHLQQHKPDLNRIIAADPLLSRCLQALISGELGDTFRDLYTSLTQDDRYMVLSDFSAYRAAVKQSDALYRDQSAYAKMAVCNIAAAGYFCADRSVRDYARDIWKL